MSVVLSAAFDDAVHALSHSGYLLESLDLNTLFSISDIPIHSQATPGIFSNDSGQSHHCFMLCVVSLLYWGEPERAPH